MNITLRITLVVAVIFFFCILVYLLKKKSLSVKYSLLWLLSGIVLSVLIFIPDLLSIFVRFLGIESSMNGLFVISIGFIIILLMSLTAIVSGLNLKIRTLVQEIASLEKRIRDLEGNDNTHFDV